MIFKRFSLHKFTSKMDLTFNPIEYSKFKFGSKTIAIKFGTDLYESFIQTEIFNKILNILNLNPDKRIIIMSSPYVSIPTATFAMKEHFLNLLNEHLVNLNLKPSIETKISRKSSYKEDYGELSKEQRYTIMENDIFHVDREILNDNICIYLDDIVITGAHEYRIQKMLNKYNLINDSTEHIFLYFAQLTNIDEDPTIENYLNYSYVKNLNAIDHIIKDDTCILNTRIVKYILDYDHTDFLQFITQQSKTFIDKLYYLSLGNSYHLIPDYQENLNYLKKIR